MPLHPHRFLSPPYSERSGVRLHKETGFWSWLSVSLGMLLGSMCWLLAAQAFGDPRMDAFKAISHAYALCDDAAQAKSVEGTLSIDTADYKVVDPKGKTLFVNGAKMREGYRQTYTGATEVRQHTNLQKVEMKQGIAITTILQHLELSAMDPKINNWRTRVIDWQMEDRWVSTKSGWKRTQTKVQKQSSSIRVGPVQ